MTLMTDLIECAKMEGFAPLLNSSGKSMQIFQCPSCGQKSLGVFAKGNYTIDACICGYRKSGYRKLKPTVEEVFERHLNH